MAEIDILAAACKEMQQWNPSHFPACHSWPVIQAEIERRRERIESLFPRLAAHLVGLVILDEWQQDRCALCGRGTRAESVIHDHDHTSGLVRGLLCRSCNAAEWRPGALRGLSPQAVRRYQDLPPTAMLRLSIPYRQIKAGDRVALGRSVADTDWAVALNEAERRMQATTLVEAK